MNKLEKKLYRVSCPPKKIVYTGVNRQYTGLFKPEIPTRLFFRHPIDMIVSKGSLIPR